MLIINKLLIATLAYQNPITSHYIIMQIGRQMGEKYTRV